MGVVLTIFPEVVSRKVVRGVVVEVVDKPAMTERAVRYVGYTELLGHIDEPVSLMHCLERRVLRLDSIDSSLRQLWSD